MAALCRSRPVRARSSLWPITATEKDDDLLALRPGDAEPRGVERWKDGRNEATAHPEADLGDPILPRPIEVAPRSRAIRPHHPQQAARLRPHEVQDR